ncbi:hypothetical protein D3C85_1702620 [compost metagenome]
MIVSSAHVVFAKSTYNSLEFDAAIGSVPFELKRNLAEVIIALVGIVDKSNFRNDLKAAYVTVGIRVFSELVIIKESAAPKFTPAPVPLLV